jgi:DNA-binding MarR family transcriptional regulator
MYFSANQLARHLNTVADEAFKDLDITPTQGFTLVAIGELDKHTPSEIAAELEMKPSTITRFLDKLEKLGYVNRTYLGRKTEIDITKEGSEKLKEILECWKRIHDISAEIFGEKTEEEITKKIIEANKLFKEKNKK